MTKRDHRSVKSGTAPTPRQTIPSAPLCYAPLQRDISLCRYVESPHREIIMLSLSVLAVSWRVAPGSLATVHVSAIQGLALLPAVHAHQMSNMACALVSSNSRVRTHAHLIF